MPLSGRWANPGGGVGEIGPGLDDGVVDVQVVEETFATNTLSFVFSQVALNLLALSLGFLSRNKLDCIQCNLFQWQGDVRRPEVAVRERSN